MQIDEIYKDAYHIKDVIPACVQKNVVDTFAKIEKKLYTPKLKYGNAMNLKMLCFGKHWNPIDYKYYDTRVDFDDARCMSANFFKHVYDICSELSLDLFPYHNPNWDICIFNYYDLSGSLGMHVDNSESHESLNIGHPVASVSFGASANFAVGGLVRNDDKTHVLLQSGDVFLFGGSSRLRYHGIEKVMPASGDVTKLPIEGRINLTFRKY